MSASREKLHELIKERSFKMAPDEGPEFTLASGKKTRYYFDLKMILLDPSSLVIVTEALWDFLGENGLRGSFDGAGGLTMGADPITYALSSKAWQEGKDLFPLIVRKTVKDHGTKKPVEGYVDRCKKVLCLEDVVTTGGSIIKAVESFRSEGLEVDQALAILDRLEGGRDALEKEGIKLRSLLNLSDFI